MHPDKILSDEKMHNSLKMYTIAVIMMPQFEKYEPPEIQIMDTMLLIVDVLIIFYGGKSLYEWFKMKRSGELLEDSKLLYPSNVGYKDCRDTDGYYAFIMPHFFVFGLVSLLAGIASLLVDYAKLLPGNVTYGAIALLILVVIYFSVVIRKGYRRYF